MPSLKANIIGIKFEFMDQVYLNNKLRVDSFPIPHSIKVFSLSRYFPANIKRCRSIGVPEKKNILICYNKNSLDFV